MPEAELYVGTDKNGGVEGGGEEVLNVGLNPVFVKKW